MLNVEVDNLTMEQFLRAFDSGMLVTPNTDHMLLLQEHQGFLKVYREAEFVTVDSQILKWAMRFLGSPVNEKLSGSDFSLRFATPSREPFNAPVSPWGAGGRGPHGDESNQYTAPP